MERGVRTGRDSCISRLFSKIIGTPFYGPFCEDATLFPRDLPKDSNLASLVECSVFSSLGFRVLGLGFGIWGLGAVERYGSL